MAQYRSIMKVLLLRDPWHYVAIWMLLTAVNLQRLSERRIARICACVQECGQSSAAQEISGGLRAVAECQFSPASRFLFKAIVVVIGGLTFGRGFYLLTESVVGSTDLSNFIPVATFVGGLFTSACVDTLATIAATNWNKRRDLRLHLQPFEQSWKASEASATVVTKAYHGARCALVRKVEGRSGIWQIPLHTLLAVVLSGLEFTVTLQVVRSPLSQSLLAGLLNMTSPDGVPNSLELAISSLPVVLTWASAFIQSYYFERPEYTRDWIRRYCRYIKPSDAWSDEVKHDWVEDRLYEDGCLNAELDFILGRHTNGDLKNLQMADADYDAAFIKAKMHQALEDYRVQVRYLREQSHTESISLPERAPLPPLLTQDRCDLEIFEQEERRRCIQDAWVREESQKLSNRLQEALKTAETDCRSAIQSLYQKWQEAAARYQAGYRQWQRLNKREDDAA